jgi:hypothetical protein
VALPLQTVPLHGTMTAGESLKEAEPLDCERNRSSFGNLCQRNCVPSP